MIRESSKEALRKLDLEYCPVAVKFCFNRPKGYNLLETDKPVCHHLKNVQETGETYYIEVAKEGCMGKFVFGAEPIEEFAESGAVGFQHGIFRQQACNARLYYDIEFFKPGTCNFVIFGPAAEVDFDPDLIVFVAPTDKADIIMRATSYCTGDFYEFKSTNVLGCHWLYNYPYMTGKVNTMVTGMHFGRKARKVMPAGMVMMSIPFDKIPIVTKNLNEMPWELPAYLYDTREAWVADERQAYADLAERAGGEMI